MIKVTSLYSYRLKNRLCVPQPESNFSLQFLVESCLSSLTLGQEVFMIIEEQQARPNKNIFNHKLNCIEQHLEIIAKNIKTQKKLFEGLDF